MSKKINPIISGFAPDPSICRVNDDFYLVTSSFSYFPGIPIYHSKDLINWSQIGNVLTRQEQLKLDGVRHSQGIFAPCIRYNNGIFYVITTNVSYGGSFIITAKKPEGPWSDPFFLEGADGIDPSLFFCPSGKVYYVGTRPNHQGEKYDGDWEVWLSELDINHMKLIGETKCLWQGAMKDVIWPEGPHLYYVNDYYYLLIAEGGTGINHSVTIARSRNIWGPYENNPKNPILTHRHLGKDYEISNVGHGDLIQTLTKEWFLVCLATRQINGRSSLGRETFLAKVDWEDDWPVVNKGIGKLLLNQPDLAITKDPLPKNNRYFFEEPIAIEFIFLRNPDRSNFEIDLKDNCLKLTNSKVTIKDLDSPAYVGLRQQEHNFTIRTKLLFNPNSNFEEAGLIIVQNNLYHVRFVKTLSNGKNVLKVILCSDGKEKLQKEIEIVNEEIKLIMKTQNQKVTCFYQTSSGDKIKMVENIDTSILSTEIAGGFVGCTAGVYASSNGKESKNHGKFYWLEMENC